ncbi:hypothetical protein HMPREF9413_0644 [Paenibacillus sp. HGF7]|nr:hypothetical protein HMPREF9413_0644 [Paenibacillus sp. HGF7]
MRFFKNFRKEWREKAGNSGSPGIACLLLFRQLDASAFF